MTNYVKKWHFFFKTSFSMFSIRFSTLDHKIKSGGQWNLSTWIHFWPKIEDKSIEIHKTFAHPLTHKKCKSLAAPNLKTCERFLWPFIWFWDYTWYICAWGIRFQIMRDTPNRYCKTKIVKVLGNDSLNWKIGCPTNHRLMSTILLDLTLRGCSFMMSATLGVNEILTF